MSYSAMIQEAAAKRDIQHGKAWILWKAEAILATPGIEAMGAAEWDQWAKAQAPSMEHAIRIAQAVLEK